MQLHLATFLQAIAALPVRVSAALQADSMFSTGSMLGGAADKFRVVSCTAQQASMHVAAAVLLLVRYSIAELGTAMSPFVLLAFSNNPCTGPCLHNAAGKVADLIACLCCACAGHEQQAEQADVDLCWRVCRGAAAAVLPLFLTAGTGLIVFCVPWSSVG
jgi:hypothetical protein